MIQATTQPPSHYGQAYAQTLAAAADLTGEQIDAIRHAYERRDDVVYLGALCRLDQSLYLLDYEVTTEGSLLPLEAVQAVLARDRGLLTDGDYQVLTGPWRAANLDLPHQSTSFEDDAAPVSQMTSDRIADELLHEAFGTSEYGAVLALASYNHAELLAHHVIRTYIAGVAGHLTVAWPELLRDLARPFFADQLRPETHVALARACELWRSGVGDLDDDNAEVLTWAFAYAAGAEHMINRRVGAASAYGGLPAEPSS